LFSEAARAQNLSIDSIGLDRVELERNLALREELYNQKIGSKNITIPDSTTRIHYQWKNTEILLKHLFHPDKSTLDTLMTSIEEDPSKFSFYADKLFKDDILKKSGGSLGWISYNTLDPNLEQVAFSMPFDKATGPIRSSYGWHILLKKDEKKQMIISEEDYQNTKGSLNSTITKKKAQIMANDYINSLMENDVEIDDELAMNTLRKIHAIVFKKNNQKKIIQPKNTQEITEYIIDLKLNSKITLATFKQGAFTVNDLLNNLRNSNPKTFLDNPVQAFYISLRNKILTEEAIHHGLLTNKNVQRKVKSKEDQYMAREFLLSLSTKNEKENFSKKEIKAVTKNLKKQFPVTIYKEHLNRLFQPQ
jgi:parvulin-like peptidyl-prolyl isomerase